LPSRDFSRVSQRCVAKHLTASNKCRIIWVIKGREANQVLLPISWMICGWTCAAVCTPRWAWSGFRAFLVLLCGAIVGPFGVFWIINEGPGLFDNSYDDTARRKVSPLRAGLAPGLTKLAQTAALTLDQRELKN
jgi:hypothetical protein